MVGATNQRMFHSGCDAGSAPARLFFGALQDLAEVDVVLAGEFLDQLIVRIAGLHLARKRNGPTRVNVQS